jgi:hypothetical protein
MLIPALALYLPACFGARGGYRGSERLHNTPVHGPYTHLLQDMIGFPSHVVVDPSDTVRGNAVLPKSVLPTLLAKKGTVGATKIFVCSG